MPPPPPPINPQMDKGQGDQLDPLSVPYQDFL